MLRWNKRRSRKSDQIWQPLNVQRNEFRILELKELQHEQGEAIIHASLRNVPVNAHPPYDALSYSWGTREGEQMIILNGTKHLVTKNLQEALSMFLARGVTNVWVDALCIDQEDPYEKGAQVQRMATIFQEAENVTVWLGSASHGSDRVISFFKNVDLTTLEKKSWVRPVKGSDGRLSEFAKRFLSFLQRSYWYRTWIVQEIAVAQNITVCCGTESIDGTLFESLFSQTVWQTVWKGLHFGSLGQEEVQVFEAFGHIVNIWSARYAFRNRQPANLLDLLLKTRFGTTTLLLDRVYAILGLAFDQKAFISEPDYTLEPHQLCLQMSKRFIKSTGSLDLILLSEHPGDVHSNSMKNLELPSWCFAFVNDDLYFGNFKDCLAYVNGHASKLRCGRTTKHWNTTSFSSVSKQRIIWDAQALKVAGLRLGKITGFGPIDCMDNQLTSYNSEKLLCLPALFDSVCRLLTIHSHMYEKIEQVRKLVLHLMGCLPVEGTGLLLSEKDPDKVYLQESNFLRWQPNQDQMRNWYPHTFLGLDVYYAEGGKKIELSSSLPEIVRKTIKNSQDAFNINHAPKFTAEELDHIQQAILEFCEGPYPHLFLIDSEFVGSTRKLRSSFSKGIQDVECFEAWLLAGCSMPVILEKLKPGGSAEQSTYRILSEALVDTINIHGRWRNVMNGEAWRNAKEKDYEFIKIV